ncbi:MAG: ribonuclease P protein component [Bacteriovoracaceae bacterium]
MIQEKINAFGKSFRLREKKDFAHLHSDSRYISDPLFKIYYKRSLISSKNTRLGISVSRKVGNSVARNRLKRILRESFRTSKYKSLGIDLLINLRPKQFDDISAYENSLLKRFINSLDKIYDQKHNKNFN